MTEDRRLLALRIGALSVLAFVSMLSYAIARPATESLFLEAAGARGLLLAWPLVAVTHLGVVAVYSRFVARMDLVRLYGNSAGISGLVLVALLLLRALGAPHVEYALYIWKEIYIIIVVEAYYTYTNTVFRIQTARWTYGLFGVLSSLGSIVGGLGVGPLAARLGTVNALWLVAPPLFVTWILCIPFARRAGARAPEGDEPAGGGSLTAALGVIRRSSYLLLVLALIAVVQVVVTLVDLEFNTVLETAYPDVHERTGVTGQVYSAIAIGTLVMNALAGPILRLAGVPLVLLSVPVVLLASLAAYAAHPRFIMVAALKWASKVLDYTIFRAAKEILYIPLSYADKTQGKTVVDVLTYRLAKGATGIALRGIGLFVNPIALALPGAGVLCLGWVAVTVVVARRFRRLVSRDEEMGGRKDP